MNLPSKSTWNQVNNIVSYLLIFGIISTTLLSLVSIKASNQYLELASHFKLQYLVLNLLLLGLVSITQRKLLLVALFCVGVNSTEILPWYIPQLGAINDSEGEHLRLFQSNVQISNKRYLEVISLVRELKPDIAVFLEIDQLWSRELEALRNTLPYSLERNRIVGVRISIYSRLPLENASIELFGTAQVASLLADIKVQGQSVSMIVAHPLTPTTQRGFQQRNKQLEAIGSYVSQVKKPVVVVGDLNITMWSPFYKRFIQTSGLKNARSGFGVLPTWPTFSPLLYIPIDHCLVSPEIKVLESQTGRNIGSDHLPLITDLIIPRRTTGNS